MLRITEGMIKKPNKVCIYGLEGLGKSTLAAQAPDALFFDIENGTHFLDVKRTSPATWEELIAGIHEVAATPGLCKTVVIDTLDKAETMCATYICKKYNVAGIESFGYGKGYVYLAEEFAKLLSALDGVIAAGINVIVIAHAFLRKQELPDEAGAFDRWELKLSKKVSPMTKEWCDALLFVNYKTYVITAENGTKKGSGGKRMIYASHTATYDAKNRMGLPDEMELRYANIASIFINTAESQNSMTAHQKLTSMMLGEGVSEAELQKVISDHNYYPIDTPVAEYDDKLINEVILPYWDDVVKTIQQARNQSMMMASPEAPTNN